MLSVPPQAMGDSQTDMQLQEYDTQESTNARDQKQSVFGELSQDKSTILPQQGMQEEQTTLFKPPRPQKQLILSRASPSVNYNV